MALRDLDSSERLRLMRFVCAFAWADLIIADSERRLVDQLIVRLGLDTQEAHQVHGWLTVPPRAEDLDPLEVPVAHRDLFIETVRTMIEADGIVAESEAINLELFEALLQ